MSEEKKHPSLLAQEAKIQMDRICDILNPELTHFPSQVRVNQCATIVIDIIDKRLLAINDALSHDTYGFSDYLLDLKENYKTQLAFLKQVQQIPS